MFRVTFGYDELRRNRSDSYQTPYNGAGTNILTLPGTWQVPLIPSSAAANNRNTSLSASGLVTSIGEAPYLDTQTGSPTIGTPIAPNAAQLALVNGAADADLPLFHNVDLSTKRTRYDAGFAANISPAWSVDFGVRAEHKDGMKPMGTVSRNTGGDISTIIPDLIDTDTSQVNTSVNYKARARLRAGGVLRIVLHEQRHVHVLAELGDRPDRDGDDEPDEQYAEQHVQPDERAGALQPVARHASWSPTDPTRATRRTTCSSSTPRRRSCR